ncbi:MAG: hypothetical protein FAF03_04045 [Epsilonproteobacteria bacterium]|nr:hypothetical protein [Campylobacterota bacterium]
MIYKRDSEEVYMSIVRIVCLMLVYYGVSFANTTVNIVCDEEDAILYVNGEKSMQITQKTTPIKLTKGSYEFMVSKPLDEDWQLVGRKNIEVRDETSIDVKLGMDIEKNIKENKQKQCQ